MVQRIVILKSLPSILNEKLQRCLNRETRHKKFKLLTNLKQLEIKTHHQKSQLTAIGAHSGTGRNARLIAEEVIRLGPVPAPILLHFMMGRSARARLWRSDLVRLETVQVMTDKAALIVFFDIFAINFGDLVLHCWDFVYFITSQRVKNLKYLRRVSIKINTIIIFSYWQIFIEIHGYSVIAAK